MLMIKAKGFFKSLLDGSKSQRLSLKYIDLFKNEIFFGRTKRLITFANEFISKVNIRDILFSHSHTKCVANHTHEHIKRKNFEGQ